MPLQIDSVVYNEYGVEKTLMANNKYIVYLDVRDLHLKFAFTSLYDPLYSTADLIRDDIGLFIADMTDDEVNKHIYLASREAQELAYNPDASVGQPPFDFENPPYYVCQYVRYRAGFKLASKQYAAMAKQIGSKKTLGDLSIDVSYTLKDLRELLKLLKDELTPWENQLRGYTNKGRAAPVVVVKGGSIESPLTIERTDF